MNSTSSRGSGSGPRRIRLQRSSGSGWADAALAAFVMLAVGMLIVPLPTALLDLLLASNLAIACVLLFTALYVPNALGFATLPTLLLVTTLYRLALNVSSTRLILLQADAGRVIRAFGDFVVRGNYVVGGVVFLILTLIQYLVIAKGSERVAEVGARFSLDAMPGKQLAIDADLRAGALHVDAARRRRAQLEQESQFYGAMDGAMKFVKGDAIAGIVIAVISLLGGTAIGVGMNGLAFSTSLKRYGLLTIGDGLVAQIPSLVISIAAGLVVTRVGAREQASSLGQDVARQLFQEPQVLGAAAVFLALLGLVPGLPAAPFLVIGLVLAVAAYARQRVRVRERLAAEDRAEQEDAALSIELGSELARASDRLASEQAVAAVCARLDAALYERLGVHLPSPRLREHSELAGDALVLRLHGVVVHDSRVPRAQSSKLAGVLADELPHVLAERTRELLCLDDVRRALDTLAERSPVLVQSVVPERIGVPLLTEVLRRLLDEGVSIRPLARILEALAAPANHLPAKQPAALGAGPNQDPAALAELARHALREQIVRDTLHERGAQLLHVHRVDALIEDALRDAHALRSPGQALPLARELARDIALAASRAKAKHGAAPVLVTQPELRRGLWELLAPELPRVRVLAYAELPANMAIEEREPIAP